MNDGWRGAYGVAQGMDLKAQSPESLYFSGDWYSFGYYLNAVTMFCGYFSIYRLKYCTRSMTERNGLLLFIS